MLKQIIIIIITSIAIVIIIIIITPKSGNPKCSVPLLLPEQLRNFFQLFPVWKTTTLSVSSLL